MRGSCGRRDRPGLRSSDNAEASVTGVLEDKPSAPSLWPAAKMRVAASFQCFSAVFILTQPVSQKLLLIITYLLTASGLFWWKWRQDAKAFLYTLVWAAIATYWLNDQMKEMFSECSFLIQAPAFPTLYNTNQIIYSLTSFFAQMKSRNSNVKTYFRICFLTIYLKIFLIN